MINPMASNRFRFPEGTSGMARAALARLQTHRLAVLAFFLACAAVVGSAAPPEEEDPKGDRQEEDRRR